MTFPAGWSRRAPIVIAATEDVLSNFPVHLDAACFPAEALDSGSANKANSDGSDLRFTSDLAGTNLLPFQVERWIQDASAGNRRANVHVKVPATSFTTTTTIYTWYKNASATMPAPTDPIGSQAVWDSFFVGVWNLDSTTSIPNSSAGVGPAATIEGSPATTVDGPTGVALDLDGTNDAMHFGATNYSDSLCELILKCDATTDQVVFAKSVGATISMSVYVQSTYPKAFCDTDGSYSFGYAFADTVAASTSNWEYWAVRSRSTAGGHVVSLAVPSTEQTHQAYATDGTYFYSIGGAVGGSVVGLTVNNRYDPVANTWTTRTALPAGRWGMAGCYLSGKIYCMGGADGASGSNRNDIFDIAGNSWSAGTNLPAALLTVTQGQRACTDGTYVYVTNSGVLQRYDPVGDSWSAMATLSAGADPGTWQSLICDGTYIYAIGGANASGNIYRYTIVGDTWNSNAIYDTAPYGVWAAICEPVGDGTWLWGFGRPTFGGTEQHNQLYNYNPSTKTWVKLRSYDVPANAIAAMVYSGKLYVYGYWVIGSDELYSKGHHACYNIATGLWETLPFLMEFQRNDHGVSGYLESLPLHADTGKLYIGREDTGTTYSSAKVGHFRRSNSARSKAWLKATSLTLLTASTFAVVGAAASTAVTHSSSGSLVSQVSAVVGTGAHTGSVTVNHITSGTLQGPGAQAVGSITSSAVAITLTPGDLAAIANAVWSDPRALTVGKFLALK